VSFGGVVLVKADTVAVSVSQVTLTGYLRFVNTFSWMQPESLELLLCPLGIPNLQLNISCGSESHLSL